MAGGNKLEILMKIKSEDSPLNKLKSKMQSLMPAATKIEEKLSKLGNKVGGSGFEKLKSKMAGLIPSVSQLQSKIQNFKFENLTNGLINGVEKIPLIGKRAASGLDSVRDKFNSLRGIGSSLGSLFPKLGEKIKKAFKGESLKKFGSKLKEIGNKISSIFRKLSKFGMISSMIGGLTGGLSFAGIAKASDENSLRNSRLGMVTNDVVGLKQKTFAASQQSGADYGQQLDSIAKLKMLTKGLFNDAEAVKFTSTLDKAFKVSGTSAGEASAAMYQLNQAMTSGKLQGDEFRSVMENAPILAQKIAESMGVSMAQLKKLGSEGKITSDVIKKAVLGSADDIEAKYNQMPLTFGKVWQQAQNAGQQAMDGLLTKVNQLLNTPMGQKMAQDLQGAFTGFAGMANGALDGILNVFGKLNFAPLLEPLKGIGQTISQAFSGIGGEGLTNTIIRLIHFVIV